MGRGFELSERISFARSKGSYAGLSLDGAVLSPMQLEQRFLLQGRIAGGYLCEASPTPLRRRCNSPLGQIAANSVGHSPGRRARLVGPWRVSLAGAARLSARLYGR